MFQVLKSIRESLVSSFKEGVYWRESVITRTDEELHAAATKSVDKQFLPDAIDLESDPIIVALRRVATKENAESINGAIEEIRRVRKLVENTEVTTTSLEDIVAVQRAEINNLMSRLSSAQKDIETLHKAVDDKADSSNSATYDIALKALHNSRMREAELRNLASGIVDSFQTTSHQPISALDTTARDLLRETIAKNAMEAYEGTGSWILEVDHGRWFDVADAIIASLEVSAIVLPEEFAADAVGKIANNIFQAFCVHYGLDPNPSMLSFGDMTTGQIEIYDRLRNVSRLAANAVVGRHLDEKVATPTLHEPEVNIFSTLESKDTP